MKRSLSLLALVALLAPLAGAQSLSEAAAKERERRKGAAPAKVYTDSDVRTAAPSAPVEENSGAAAAAKPGAEGTNKDEKSADALRAEEEKTWREQVDKLSAEVARLEAEVTRLEAEANDTRGYMYSNRRTVALENLDKARADLGDARQKLDDLLESGRRKGLRAP